MVYAEIQAQRDADGTHGPSLGLFTTRASAVLDAAEAHANEEAGAEEGLRQALIDLAACAEAIASRLPAPDQWPEVADDLAVIRTRCALAEATAVSQIRWTRELIIAAIHRFVELHGRLPRATDWAEKAPDHPTTQTVRNQFGSWSAGLEAAGVAPPRAGSPPKR